jgi:3'-phosphoadenosine 5'-phosphosulfate sulfotransferase (PAPS reductase)/FAD synthetase
LNLNELRILQNYPLELKVEKTKLRIKEWYEHYNGEVYVSFSGGKDSTVLLDIVRSMYPDIEAVFINTGLEYPEIYKFVKTFKSVTILKPEMNFKQVINTYGYPVISKENSQYIYEIRHSTKKMRQRRLYGDSKGRFKLPNKYHYLIGV